MSLADEKKLTYFGVRGHVRGAVRHTGGRPLPFLGVDTRSIPIDLRNPCKGEAKSPPMAEQGASGVHIGANTMPTRAWAANRRWQPARRPQFFSIPSDATKCSEAPSIARLAVGKGKGRGVAPGIACAMCKRWCPCVSPSCVRGAPPLGSLSTPSVSALPTGTGEGGFS